MKQKLLILVLLTLVMVFFAGNANAYIQQNYLERINSTTYSQLYYVNFWPETLDRQFVWAEITFSPTDDIDLQYVEIYTSYSQVNQSHCIVPSGAPAGFCSGFLGGGNIIYINTTDMIYSRDQLNSFTYPVIVYRELRGNRQDIKVGEYLIDIDAVYRDGTVKRISPVSVSWKIATSDTNICDIFRKYYMGIIHNDADLLYKWSGMLIDLNGKLIGTLFMILKIAGFIMILGALSYMLLFLVKLVRGREGMA